MHLAWTAITAQTAQVRELEKATGAKLFRKSDRYQTLNTFPLLISLIVRVNSVPKISFSGQILECQEGVNLRQVLRNAKLPLYNAAAKWIHCRGLGTCGTCAVEIEGCVSEMTAVEKWRLGFPPHRSSSGLRLACQCKVLGDLKITKHQGMWGNKRIAGDQNSVESPTTSQ